MELSFWANIVKILYKYCNFLFSLKNRGASAQIDKAYDQGWTVFQILVFKILIWNKQNNIFYLNTFEKNLIYFVFKYI